MMIRKVIFNLILLLHTISLSHQKFIKLSRVWTVLYFIEQSALEMQVFTLSASIALREPIGDFFFLFLFCWYKNKGGIYYGLTQWSSHTSLKLDSIRIHLFESLFQRGHDVDAKVKGKLDISQCQSGCWKHWVFCYSVKGKIPEVKEFSSVSFCCAVIFCH